MRPGIIPCGCGPEPRQGPEETGCRFRNSAWPRRLRTRGEEAQAQRRRPRAKARRRVAEHARSRLNRFRRLRVRREKKAADHEAMLCLASAATTAD